MYQDDDSLDRVKRGLYSRKQGNRSASGHSQNTDETSDVQEDWTYEKPKKKEKPKPKPRTPEEGSRVRLFVVISIVIFVLVAGFAVYRFFFADDLTSPRNVHIDIDAPTTARAGDEVNFDISIENTNETDLLASRLTLTFPEHTLAANESGEEVERLTQEIGVIEAGEVVNEEFEVLLFGEEGGEVEIDLLLEYSTDVSSAKLSNQESHVVRISSSPVSVLIAPEVKEVQSGSPFEIELDVSSNTNAEVQDVLVEADYPGGFTFISSNPSPVEGENVWRLGDLNPQETESITIEGYLEGQDNEDRYFSFDVGTEGGSEGYIGRLYASSQEFVTITLPQIALGTSINKSTGGATSVPTGARVQVDINWSNTLSVPLQNMVIEVEIDDRYVREGSIEVNNGFYQSANDTLVWSQSTNSELNLINPRARGSVSFSFEAAGGNELSGAINPEIPLAISARASEPQGSGSRRNLSNEIERVVRIASNLAISQYLSHEEGSFTNTGPTPPRAESETTYTVTWSVSNAGNEASGATVRAALPAYVEFIDAEEDSNIRYSQVTNEVIWNVGDVRENATNESASFQIAVTPSRSQVGRAPVLVREAIIEGRDTFTGSTLRGSASSLTTSDLAEFGAGVVIE